MSGLLFFSQRWFSKIVSIESVIRRRENKEAIMNSLRFRDLFTGVFEARFLCSIDYTYLAYSLDGIAVVLTLNEQYIRLAGDGDIQLDGNFYWMTEVEIITKAAPTTFCIVLHLAT